MKTNDYAIMEQQPTLGIMQKGLSSRPNGCLLFVHRLRLAILSNDYYPSEPRHSNPPSQHYFLSLNFDFNFPKNPLARFAFLSAVVELLAAGFGLAAETALSAGCDV